jgi:hypothetical protein
MLPMATLKGFSSEMSKLADAASREWARNASKTGWGPAVAKKAVETFHRMGPTGKSAVLSGIAGGAWGAVNGLTSSAPDDIDQWKGTPTGPKLTTRLQRAGAQGLSSAVKSAVLGAVLSYGVQHFTKR